METTIGKFIDGQIRYQVLEEYKREVRLENGKIVHETVTVEQQFEPLRKDGWKMVELFDESQMQNEQEFYSTTAIPIDNGETIGFAYQKSLDKRLVQREIERLKSYLSDTDYKVVKCYEATMMKKTLPYDLNEICSERQIVRDRINELEAMIS
ncbi:MAG: hypothetical protein IKU35_07010 [Bacteroidaceae bacterium]|nr:hypothetical protein [Bacteroidaceae bacterium]